jgi:hypothetical protein
MSLLEDGVPVRWYGDSGGEFLPMLSMEVSGDLATALVEALRGAGVDLARHHYYRGNGRECTSGYSRPSEVFLPHLIKALAIQCSCDVS